MRWSRPVPSGLILDGLEDEAKLVSAISAHSSQFNIVNSKEPSQFWVMNIITQEKTIRSGFDGVV